MASDCGSAEQKPQETQLISPIVCISSACIGLFACLLSVINSIEERDIPVVIESGTYFMIMLYKLLILLTTKFNRPFYQSFLKALKDDFQYIASTGIKYKERYFEVHLNTFKATVLTAIFIGGIAGVMVICTNIMLAIYIVKHGFYSSKPLPFPFWLFGADCNVSPLFDVMYFISIACLSCHACTYIFMMQTQVVWVRQITSKADLIIWNIQDLLVDIHPCSSVAEKARIIKLRLRNIVKMHQSMYRLLDDYAGVFKKCLMFEQTFGGPIICVTAFCAAEKLDSGEVHAILILLSMSVIVLVYIPSYLCTYLAIKVTSINDACWDISFWTAGPLIRPYLVIIMQRAMRPLPIQAAGFEDVSVETYSRKMATAYSWFNMLRQANFDI